ncbi:PREDICTED: centrosome-associated protein CEP250-like [Crocodylus porosus]|uniref:centrosome-associated protein CEP250-like n=1 Tax=Crocodylus porosus TaxID=8502 RepID=UPI00093BA055|nr:PREDICTED: centrosome-associated protein CEP250-like [Crocodylus porosus]
MDEVLYAASEENIPLASRSWVGKKKRNSVFPANENQSKTEAWVKRGNPSNSHVTEDSLKNEAEPKSQETITSSVSLPGSVTNYLDEIQGHPSYEMKSIMIDEESTQVSHSESWLDKLGINKNKLAFLKCLIWWKESTTTIEKDHQTASGVRSHDAHGLTELDGCMTKDEQAYIPYKLAKLYITKIVKDMQQMKIRHMNIINELDCIRKEKQEQAVIVLKNHYNGKIKTLRAQLEAYQELVDKRNGDWQDMIKNLREKNRQLSQEKKGLLCQIKQQNEKWEEEKAWILDHFSQKLDHLYMEHVLTLQELQKITLSMEKVQELMNFQVDFPQQKASITAEKTATSEVLEINGEQVLDELEKHEQILQKELLQNIHTKVQMIRESLLKREREIIELLQRENICNKTMKPQITMAAVLKTLVKEVHAIYNDVPEAQQYISQLIRKNDAERADQKEAFNNAQADILAYEVFYGCKPMDNKREQLPMKLFRNLVIAKSDLQYVEAEKTVLDCITTGEISEWIDKNSLHFALLASDKEIHADDKTHFPDEVLLTPENKSQDVVTKEPPGIHHLGGKTPYHYKDGDTVCKGWSREEHSEMAQE